MCVYVCLCLSNVAYLTLVGTDKIPLCVEKLRKDFAAYFYQWKQCAWPPPVIVPVGEQQHFRGVSLLVVIDLNDLAGRFDNR